MGHEARGLRAVHDREKTGVLVNDEDSWARLAVDMGA
jgi:hypothetical protein